MSAVEVSVLLNLPNHATLVLGLTKLAQAGFITIELASEGDMRVRVAGWIRMEDRHLSPGERTAARRHLAFQTDRILLPSEDILLDLLEQNADRDLADLRTDIWMAYLKKTISEKLAGYQRENTQEYYLAFVAHRIEKVWQDQSRIADNIAWYLCAFFCSQLKTKRVQEVVEGFNPDWLPAPLSLQALIRSCESSLETL
jgi:hypothetical protein